MRTTYGATYKIAMETSLVTIGEAGVNETSAEAVAYTRYHQSYDLPAGLLGVKFQSQGSEFQFLGINTKAPKFPIVAKQTATGKTFKFPAAYGPIIARQVAV